MLKIIIYIKYFFVMVYFYVGVWIWCIMKKKSFFFLFSWSCICLNFCVNVMLIFLIIKFGFIIVFKKIKFERINK